MIRNEPLESFMDELLQERLIDREVAHIIDLSKPPMPDHKLTHDDTIPFGPHQGTEMREVPVEWLHEFWNNTKAWNEDQVAVMEYIRDHMAMLQHENTRLKWRKEY